MEQKESKKTVEKCDRKNQEEELLDINELMLSLIHI